jgi:hypothetical protein
MASERPANAQRFKGGPGAAAAKPAAAIWQASSSAIKAAIAPLMAASTWGWMLMDALLFVSYQLSAVSFQLKAKNLKKPSNYQPPAFS